jgi:hypothetical protein
MSELFENQINNATLAMPAEDPEVRKAVEAVDAEARLFASVGLLLELQRSGKWGEKEFGEIDPKGELVPGLIDVATKFLNSGVRGETPEESILKTAIANEEPARRAKVVEGFALVAKAAFLVSATAASLLVESAEKQKNDVLDTEEFRNELMGVAAKIGLLGIYDNLPPAQEIVDALSGDTRGNRVLEKIIAQQTENKLSDKNPLSGDYGDLVAYFRGMLAAKTCYSRNYELAIEEAGKPIDSESEDQAE